MALKFQSNNGAVRFAWEDPANPGYPVPQPLWKDLRVESESFAATIQRVAIGNLSPGNQPPPGLLGNIPIGGGCGLRWEPIVQALFLAAFQEGGATPVVLTGGQSWMHRLAPNETDIDFDRPFSMMVWRDDGLPVIIAGCYVSAYSMQANVGGGPVQGSVTIPGRALTYFSVANVVAEGSTPTRPVIMGLPTHANWIKADHDVYVKVTNATPGSEEIDVKVGSASAYATLGLAVTAGQEVELTDEAGAPIGDDETPVVLYVPDFTNWALNDEWRFDGEETARPFSPSLPVVEALNVLGARVYVDGTLICEVDQVELTDAITINPSFGLCGAYSPGQRKEGDKATAGSLAAPYYDTTFKKLAEARQEFELQVLYGSHQDIGSSTDKYQYVAYMKKCLFEGSGPTLSPGAFRQSWNFTCHESSDVTYPDARVWEAQNNDSDLAA